MENHTDPPIRLDLFLFRLVLTPNNTTITRGGGGGEVVTPPPHNVISSHPLTNKHSEH